MKVSLQLLIALVGLGAACSAAHGQDAILGAESETGASRWSWFGDARLRYEHTWHLPGARYSEQLIRSRAHVDVGGVWNAMPSLDFGVAIELARGSDDNWYNRMNNDNERSDFSGLDQLFVRWRAGEHTTLLAGKAPLPLELSPLTWDRDLRPAGISLDHSIALNDFDRLQFTAGWFAGQHLYGDESRIGALQAAWRWHEGAPTRAAVIVSWLDFTNLEELTRQGLSRTNRRAGVPLLSDFRLFDVQLVGRTELGRWPLELRLDYVRNTGADDANVGARGSLVLGDRRQAHGWEFGFAYQRIQRDAVMAAFNEDDWWFHSFARGGMPWVGYGFTNHWSVRLAGFDERRDLIAEPTKRVLLDLEARW